MTSKLTRERIEWLNYAATGLAANGTEMAMSPQDVIALTECCLAAMDSEPVATVFKSSEGHAKVIMDGGLPQGYSDVYRHAQPLVSEQPAPVPVALGDLLSMAASAIEDLLEHTDPNTSYYSGVWADVPGKLRAAIQAGNSPVIPDRWIPVSERMPEEGQHIIIFCDDAFVLFAQHREGEFFDVVRDGDEFFETTSRCVTHWMPLPAPPTEVK